MLRSKIVFGVFAVLIAQLGVISALADDSVGIFTDASQYDVGNTMTISGQVQEKKMPVIALRIFDPDDKIITANSVVINDDATFSKIVSLDAPFYEEPGVYSITANYGKEKLETTFEINGEIIPDEPVVVPEPEITAELVILTSEKTAYYNGETVKITGSVSSLKDPTIIIGIRDPFNTPTGFYVASINPDLSFSTEFLIKSGVNFKAEGEYSVIAHYADSKITTSFDYAEQIEETIVQEPVIETSVEEPVVDEPVVQEPTITPVAVAVPPVPVADSIIVEPTPVVPSPQIPASGIVTADISPKVDVTPKINDNLSVEDIELGKILNQMYLNCGNYEFVDSILYYDGMGPALVRLCNFDTAMSFFDQQLREEPDNIEVLTNKGVSLNKLGFYDEAISYYEHVLSIDSQYVPALNNKANVLVQLGNYETAIAMYEDILKLAPDDTTVALNLKAAQEKFDIYKFNNPDYIPTENIQEENNEKPITSESSKTDSAPNNEKQSNVFEQFSSVLASIGSIFGF